MAKKYHRKSEVGMLSAETVLRMDQVGMNLGHNSLKPAENRTWERSAGMTPGFLNAASGYQQVERGSHSHSHRAPRLLAARDHRHLRVH